MLNKILENHKYGESNEFEWAVSVVSKSYKAHAETIAKYAAQQSVVLTALRRGLAVSIFINVVLLAVVLVTIGGN